MANIPNIHKALYPHLPKFDPSIPLNIYKNVPYFFKLLANIPVSLKTLSGPLKCLKSHMYVTSG